jgi:hypothetical protein
MPRLDKYLQAEVGFLEDLRALLAAKIAVPVVAQLENDNRILSIHVHATDGVFFDHDQNHCL